MYSLMPSELKTYGSKLLVLIATFLLVIFAWTNLFINLEANAATLEGIGNQIEGKVEKDIGTKRRAVGDIIDNPTEEAKGALTQAKGKAKQDFGTAQNKLDDAKDSLEDKTDSMLDSVRDLLD